MNVNKMEGQAVTFPIEQPGDCALGWRKGW